MTSNPSQAHEPLEILKRFVRIPSISTQSTQSGEVRRAAEFLQRLLADVGLHSSRLIEGPGHPLVCAEWLGAPGRPTLLLYGHYDVQPPEPLAEWQTSPFEPAVRGDELFGRGAADDKGPLLIMVLAVEALLRRDGRLPVNVRFLFEGEEESGGGHLDAYVRAHAAELQADAAVICDTEMFGTNLPTLTIGLRGIVYGELRVRALKDDLHSGSHGGIAPNALQAVAEIVTALKDRSGRIEIPGFYDRVRAPDDAERAAWALLPFKEEEFRVNAVGATELTGEPGLSVFERVWSRPTFEVHGITGGYIGEGAKTVIPAQATAKVSTRLVPDQTVEEAVDQIRQAVARACPRGVTATFDVLGTARPSIVPPGNPFVRTAAEALTSVFGRETVCVRSGGSLPVVKLLEEALNIPSVMFGFILPDNHAHAPNERLHLPNYFRGIQAMTRYLEMLGKIESSSG